ncbi:DUF4398 domain-containing protein [Lacimicrobium sp. SS2-24]|uniref:DUF4398 domain-containing protein n=1 Tax=Lacimicrobium sp. SS2-24 TaxID=2005569 RepID=UPI001AEFC9E6|nr:DUF4398 domain-containing protein [Lacimicrobium sp. SS2-24]
MNTFIAVPLTRTLLLSKKRCKALFMIMATTLLLGGCASALKAPTAEVEAAERAIGNAERAQTTRYTSTELNNARTELAAARSAVIARDMQQARQLALQAQASAELALARAELIKAQAINENMQQSIDVLKQEVQRNLSGVRP